MQNIQDGHRYNLTMMSFGCERLKISSYWGLCTYKLGMEVVTLASIEISTVVDVRQKYIGGAWPKMFRPAPQVLICLYRFRPKTKPINHASDNIQLILAIGKVSVVFFRRTKSGHNMYVWHFD